MNENDDKYDLGKYVDNKERKKARRALFVLVGIVLPTIGAALIVLAVLYEIWLDGSAEVAKTLTSPLPYLCIGWLSFVGIYLVLRYPFLEALKDLFKK